jgi:hypothetical protein
MQSPTNIYLDNKYTQWYFKILIRARTRPLPSGKIHKHHEPPECWGGTETYPLTIREHFIIHWLLLKMTTGLLRNKMYYAFHRLVYSKNGEIRNSRKYEIAVKNHSDAISGKNSPNYENHKKHGPMSEKHKKKISEALKNKPKSEEHKKNIADVLSLTWQITYPNGSIKIIQNLNQFCRENNLNKGNMCNVSQGRQKQHHGFKCLNVVKVVSRIELDPGFF